MPEIRNRQPNRLINEKSPYLLQHAYNPVSWYPWGEEAFTKAASEDKLVFLSIGYATCHWCHVMERESFEDEGTAGILNDHFVAVKVDREERPDIDSVYMDALNAMGQQGGWPLNVFVTPQKDPLIGGTYFPPTPKYGMRSFKEVLKAVNEAWHSNRAQLLESSDGLRRHLSSAHAERPDEGLPSAECFEKAYRYYTALYDRADYGFKTDAGNKFPPSMALSLLMGYFYRTGTPEAIEMAERTLGAMKRGGIYDQVGGGLCRYSTDNSWLVPHFEKMLYDNALFLKALVECYQLSGKDFFRQAAYDVIGYIQRDMAVSGGGIASAEDADSEGEEGKFYLWTLPEFRGIAGSDSGFLETLWSVEELGIMDGKNILHEDIHAQPQTAEEQWGPKRAEAIRANRQKLLKKRSDRPRPLRDDKVLTSWNCLYIRALAKAGLAFGDADLIRDAQSIYAFISDNLFDASGRLMRRYRDGAVGLLGYLTDYAEMGLASCELFRATSEIPYLEKTRSLAEAAIRLFLSDFGPFFETGADGEEPLRRTVNGYDGVEPSGNSSMARMLCTLSNLGVDSQRYTGIADGIFRYFKDEIEKHPVTCPAMLEAYALFSLPPTQIVLIGDLDNPELRLSREFLNQTYLADASVICVDPDGLAAMESAVPIVAGKTRLADFTAYVCTGMTCKAPVFSFDDLKVLLYDQGRSSPA